MKRLFGIALLALCFSGLNAQTLIYSIDTSGHYNKVNCVAYESFTNWEAKKKESETHLHKWVYSEYDDLNQDYGIVNLVYCPCGCPEYENQGRVCSLCFREEYRIRTYGFRSEQKPESEFKKIIKQ